VSHDVTYGAVGAIAAAIVGAAWQPWSDDAKRRRRRKKRLKIFWYGQEGDDVLDEVFDAPKRVKDCEVGLKNLAASTDEKFKKIHNGITNLTSVIERADKRAARLEQMWTENGGETNSPADVQKRQAIQQGVWKVLERDGDDEATATAETAEDSPSY
jgi:hypothetical protein